MCSTCNKIELNRQRTIALTEWAHCQRQVAFCFNPSCLRKTFGTFNSTHLLCMNPNKHNTKSELWNLGFSKIVKDLGNLQVKADLWFRSK